MSDDVNFELVDVSDAGIDIEWAVDSSERADELRRRLQECQKGYSAQKARADRYAFARANEGLALVLVDRLIDDMSRGATAWPQRVEEIRAALVRGPR
jgi:hypothetical protein